MHFFRINLLLIIIVTSVAMGLATPAQAQAIPSSDLSPSAEVTAQDAKALIATLENDQARAELLTKLKTLAAATEDSDTKSTNNIVTSTKTLLQAVGANFNIMLSNIGTLAASVQQLPNMASWLYDGLQTPSIRERWLGILTSLVSIILIGYGGYFIVQLLVNRAERRVVQRQTSGAASLLFTNAIVLLLETLPILAFVGASNMALSLFDMATETKDIAIAWINAIMLARIVVAVGKVILAPYESARRMFTASDETAMFAYLWIRRAVFVPIYGYFLLEVAKTLGLDSAIYAALLRLLGLVIVGMLIVLIYQIRDDVRKSLRGPANQHGQFHYLRRRFAHLWHLLAIAYLLIGYGVWALGVENGFSIMLRGTLYSLLAVVVGALIMKVIDLSYGKITAQPKDLQHRYPGLQQRLNRYFPVLRTVVKGIVIAVVVIAILQAWNFELMPYFLSGTGKSLIQVFFVVTLIIAVAVLAWEITNYAIERYLEKLDSNDWGRQRSARRRTLLAVTRKVVTIGLIILTSLLVLSEIGVNIAPLLATAGVLGLAIGFGSQKLVQDVITGAFILLEDLFSVGDVISVRGTAGLVENVSIRNVRLRDFSGTVHTIPFSSIDTVSNLTKDFSYYVFDIGVAYNEDIDYVMSVLHDVGKDLASDEGFKRVIRDELEVFGIDRFDDSAVIIKARIKTDPTQQWSVGREFNRRMKQKFDELGIEIPFPHRTLYFGVDKDGNSPPVNVSLTNNDSDSSALLASEQARKER